MNVEETPHSFHNTPHTYFKNALKSFEDEEIPATLQSIDAAIVFSSSSPFYIHQKIRILYGLGALKSCSQLIISQLEYLYKYGSLYLLCRSIDYLQKINHYTQGQLRTLLDQNHIPYCIADHYEVWLTSKEKPFEQLADKAIRQDDFSLCLCYCELFLKQHPLNEHIAYMEAYAYHMLNNLASAESMYEQYISLTSDKSTAKAELALVYMELSKFDSAIALLKELLESDPHNKAYLSYLGECYYSTKKYTDSIHTFEALIKYYPEDVQFDFDLAHIYNRLGRKWHSKRYLKQAAKQLSQQYKRLN